MAHTSKTVGLLCADSSDLYLAKAVYFIEKNLSESGFHSMLCTTGYTFQRKKESLKLLLSKEVDAIALVGSHFIGMEDSENNYIREAADKLPIVLLNGELDHPNVYSVSCDDYQATKDATTALIDDGIKSLLYFYDTQSYSGKKKQSGFKDACAEKGIEDTFHLLYVGDREDIDGVATRLERLWESGMHFDGIVCSEDYLALGTVKFAHRAGIMIPKNLQIIGYNNSLLTKCCDPELTSVDNHLEDISEQVVKALISVLEGGTFPEKKLFAGELIRRDTTKF
ncbi:MAG: substrate-binding domain-containing protein [Lachnospiraceae bacterium]|nr:substrate-binding domain-containing protein [Lachnospiraceae bacterium]